MNLLAAEVQRIVACQWPISLKTLYDILESTKPLAIQEWASANPCHITSLVESVRGALQAWPYALQILQHLSQAQPFRDEVFRQDPALIDTIITTATSSLDAHNIYYNLAVCILSRPLPEDLPLPASAEAFFLRAFGYAVKSPSASCIGHVYSMLNGACANLLDILPFETLDQFKNCLVRILKNTKFVEDQSLVIYCLGLIPVLSRPGSPQGALHSALSASRTPAGSPSTPKPATAQEYLKFFQSPVAHKTIQYITLRVLWACRSNADLPLEEAAESICVASEALNAVELRWRLEWAASNRHVIEKLLEKVLRSDIDPRLQFSALVFIGILTNVGNLSSRILPTYQKGLLTASKLTVTDEQFSRALELSLPLYAVHLEASFFQHVVEQAVDMVSGPVGDIRSLSMSKILFEHLIKASLESTAFGEALMACLSRDDLSALAKKLCEHPRNGPSVPVEGQGYCQSAYTRHSRELAISICSLFLKTTLVAQGRGVSLTPSLTLLLLDTQQDLAAEVAFCNHHRKIIREAPKTSLIQEVCTPCVQPSSHNWREQLAAELESEARNRHNIVVRFVGRLCQDLEKRCEDIEQPLREEKSKFKDLQAQYDELSGYASNLESQAIDRDLFLNALEQEKSQYEADQERIQSDNEKLLARIQELDKQIQEENKNSAQVLKTLQQNLKEQEDALRNALAAREQLIQKQEVKLVDLSTDLENLQGELVGKCAEVDSLRNNQGELESELKRLKAELEHERTTSLGRETQIATLQAKDTNREDELGELRVELDHAISQIRSLEMQNRALIDSSKDGMVELQEKHEAELEEMTTQASNIQSSLKDSLHALEDKVTQLERASHDLLEELTWKDGEISTLKDKVLELSDSCLQKDAALQAAQKLSSTLSAALGGINTEEPSLAGGTRPQRVSRAIAKRPGRHRSTDGHPEQHKHKYDRHSTPEQNSPVPAHTDQSLGSSASSMDNSTPKRSKPYKSFKVPTMHNARIHRGSPALTRKPLQDLSAGFANISPARHSRQAPDSSKLHKDGTDEAGVETISLYPGNKVTDVSPSHNHSTPKIPNMNNEGTVEF